MIPLGVLGAASPLGSTPLPASSTLDPALKGPNVVLSNGNLEAVKSGSGYETVYGMIGHSTGRRAFEFFIVDIPSDGSLVIGIADKTNPAAVVASYVGNNGGPVETLGYNDFNGRLYRRMTVGSTAGVGTVPDPNTGDAVTVDVDFSNSLCRIYVQGVLIGLGAIAITPGKTYFPALSVQNSGRARFRGTGLAYLPPGSTPWG